jgi:tetratricopeptide (TPR) repeat protein
MRLISLLFCLAVLADAQSLEQGIAQFHRGQYAQAEKTLEKAPESASRRAFLALSRAATGRCAAQMAELDRQMKGNPDAQLRRLTGLALVQCHLARNDFAAAFPVVLRLKAAFPGDADVLYQAAKVYMRAWNGVVAEMFEKTPASFRVNELSAEILEMEGKYPEAVAEYRKAVEKNPAALNLHYRLGRALLMESHDPANLALARKEFEAELKLNPNDAVAEYQIGQILQVEQKPVEAVARFERAVAASPEFAEALIALGKARLEAKRYPEAIELLEKAVRLRPNSEAARYSLMLSYRNAGRIDDALRQKEALDKLQSAPEGEFTEFLKKLGEKAPKK